ncbi:hypothetical protein [Roseobacter sp.]|uniref:hypothetical protein n=1 Tax=Roseobacter sp. TaxID=1907202 RepID=UPI00385DE5B6
MNKIPSDAIHWDSGDWIDWHRNALHPTTPPCAAPSEDPRARLHTLHMRMLQSARAYFELTGEHLPIYEGIAKIHASLELDLPSKINSEDDTANNVLVVTLPPNRPSDIVTIDLSEPFGSLIVVRITQSFTAECRIMARTALPDRRDGKYDIHWRDLPSYN